MAENKYFYLMLKESFFDSDDMILLESMENGYMYANILMKLYLRSLKDMGRLMYKDRIPYDVNMLAKLTRHNVDIVKSAVDTFRKMGIVEILDNGAIYMLDIQNFIGSSSTHADRQREFDRRKKTEQKLLTGDKNSIVAEICKKSDDHTEIEPYTELDIEAEIKENKERESGKPPTPQISKPKPPQTIIPPPLELVKEYCLSRNNGIDPQRFIDHYTSNGWMVGKTKMKDWQASVRTWEQRDKGKKPAERSAGIRGRCLNDD